MTTDETLHTKPQLAFPPLRPTIAVPPTKIADDTWVIHQVQQACGQPLDVYINSMVILGAEPVIVDTGTPANRTQWLEDVFALVEPEDVRWIFLSHDDVDHTGNLDEALAACPNATLVCNWAMVERHTNCFDFPLDRCRWVDATASRSTSATARCRRSARRCSTRRPREGSTTRRRRCTGRSTRSRRRCPTRRWASPTSIRTSGTSG